MLFRWLRERKRRKLLASPEPERWRAVLDRRFHHWRVLSEAERDRLMRLARVFVADKTWEPCGGIELTEDMKATIAAQACLLLLGLAHHDHFANVTTVLVYPTSFEVPATRRDPWVGAVQHEQVIPTLGLAQYRGPVVLAWDSVMSGGVNAGDGRNVVFHEFAHKLDLLDEVFDGTPPLRTARDHRYGPSFAAEADERRIEDWARAMTAAYAQLCDDVVRGRKTLLDDYAATNEAEFFAVSTEAFFEQPQRLRGEHPELYAVLQDYYRQDPAAR